MPCLLTPSVSKLALTRRLSDDIRGLRNILVQPADLRNVDVFLIYDFDANVMSVGNGPGMNTAGVVIAI